MNYSNMSRVLDAEVPEPKPASNEVVRVTDAISLLDDLVSIAVDRFDRLAHNLHSVTAQRDAREPAPGSPVMRGVNDGSSPLVQHLVVPLTKLRDLGASLDELADRLEL
jgi:hypothetical protein